jgi:hypothetical protein
MTSTSSNSRASISSASKTKGDDERGACFSKGGDEREVCFSKGDDEREVCFSKPVLNAVKIAGEGIPRRHPLVFDKDDLAEKFDPEVSTLFDCFNKSVQQFGKSIVVVVDRRRRRRRSLVVHATHAFVYNRRSSLLRNKKNQGRESSQLRMEDI